MRITQIDGIRGFFLLAMTTGHLAGVTPSILGKITHHTYGFVDAAMGFVAFSGLIIGLVYGKRLLKHSPEVMRRAIFDRTRVIFFWSALLIILSVALIPHLPNLPNFLTDPLGDQPVLAGLLALFQLRGLWGINVLSIYLAFMLFTPLALIAFKNGHYRAVFLCSFLLWVIAQTSLPELFWAQIADLAGLDQYNLTLGLYFNRFAWQVLYFCGLAIGFLMAQDKLDMRFMQSRNAALALVPCAVFIAGFGFSAFVKLQGPDGQEALYSQMVRLYWRSDLPPLRIAAFGAHIYVVLWFLTAGRGAANRAVRAISEGLHCLATAPAFIYLGQHSLQVFAWHVGIVYLYAAYVGPAVAYQPYAIKEGVIILAMISLYVPAFLHAKYQKRA